MVNQQEMNNYSVNSSDERRILIVDDEPDILSSLKDILEMEIEHCVIDLASNVDEAKLLAKTKITEMIAM